MSLIMGILEKDFLILCADTQLNKPDGSKEIIEKLIEINNNIIIGIGGQLEAANDILARVELSIGFENCDFSQYINTFAAIFDSYCQAGSPLGHVSFLIGGLFNGSLYLGCFSVIDGNVIERDVYSYIDQPIRKLLQAKDDLPHIVNVKKYVVKPDYTPIAIVEGFQQVLNIGIEFDDTINNSMTHLLLRRWIYYGSN